MHKDATLVCRASPDGSSQNTHFKLCARFAFALIHPSMLVNARRHEASCRFFLKKHIRPKCPEQHKKLHASELIWV